jgi:hypothetical protein
VPREALLDTDELYEPIEPEAKMPEVDAFDQETYDQYISEYVMIPKGDLLVAACVVGCKHDLDVNPVGQANTNPILETHVYEVQ